MRTITTINSILANVIFGQGTIIVRGGDCTAKLRRFYTSSARYLSAKAASCRKSGNQESDWLAMCWLGMSVQHLLTCLTTRHASCQPVGVVVKPVDGPVSIS